MRQDASSATLLRIQGTPTFLIGAVEDGHVTVKAQLSGAKSIAAFSAVLDPLIENLRK